MAEAQLFVSAEGQKLALCALTDAAQLAPRWAQGHMRQLVGGNERHPELLPHGRDLQRQLGRLMDGYCNRHRATTPGPDTLLVNALGCVHLPSLADHMLAIVIEHTANRRSIPWHVRLGYYLTTLFARKD